MTVKQLIDLLEKCPKDMPVRVWDDESDDYLEVTDVIFEDGSPGVDICSLVP